jgi:hypothetical protein
MPLLDSGGQMRTRGSRRAGLLGAGKRDKHGKRREGSERDRRNPQTERQRARGSPSGKGTGWPSTPAGRFLDGFPVVRGLVFPGLLSIRLCDRWVGLRRLGSPDLMILRRGNGRFAFYGLVSPCLVGVRLCDGRLVLCRRWIFKSGVVLGGQELLERALALPGLAFLALA